MCRAKAILLRETFAMAALLLLTGSARAGAIADGVFHEFSFGEAATVVVGCDPADSSGNFCLPSSGTPTSFLDAPPWTFSAPAEGATLTIVDAFESGDVFEVFDVGVSLGLTSLPGAAVDCGDDPLPCLAEPAMSRRLFDLGAGDHAITLEVQSAPSGGGSGYLQWVPIPEPGTLSLLGFGLAVLARARRRAGGGR